MSHWHEVEEAAPEVAGLARARFEATGLGLLATIRADGAPRVSGLEPLFADGDLWFGMMDSSRKGNDLRRDPRFSLHSATVDKEVLQGDAKISGRAVEETDDEAKAAFLQRFKELTGTEVPPGPFQLFRADVTEVSTLRPGGDHLDIDTWHEDRGVGHVDRY